MLLDIFDITTDLLLFPSFRLACFTSFCKTISETGKLNNKSYFERFGKLVNVSQNILQHLTKGRMSFQISWCESTISTVQ